jgi:hypothetical protein
MTASAATVTGFKQGGFPGYAVATFATTLNSTATSGVEVYLGWSNVDDVNISMYDATPEAIGPSWQYVRSTGILTIYGVAAGNSEPVRVTVFGQD